MTEMNIFMTYYDIYPILNFTKIVYQINQNLIIDSNHYQNIDFWLFFLLKTHNYAVGQN